MIQPPQSPHEFRFLRDAIFCAIETYRTALETATGNATMTISNLRPHRGAPVVMDAIPALATALAITLYRLAGSGRIGISCCFGARTAIAS